MEVYEKNGNNSMANNLDGSCSDVECGGIIRYENLRLGAACLSTNEDDVPKDHVLPAAYCMWRQLSSLVREYTLSWHQEEFEYRMKRVAIMCEIQTAQLIRAVLEQMQNEVSRQEQLLSMYAAIVPEQQPLLLPHQQHHADTNPVIAPFRAFA